MADFELKLEMLPWILSTLVITSCVHEAGHAWAAWRLGDRNESIRQRITPFTFRHISLPFTIILPTIMMLFAGMMVGGAKPVRVRLAIGPVRMAVVALAGPIGNAFCGVLSLLFVVALVHGGWLIPDMAMGFDRTYMFALQAVLLNFVLAAFNLLPIPPFDGSRIVAMFLPEKLRELYYRLTIPVIIVLIVVFVLMYATINEQMGAALYRVLLILHNTVLQVRDWVG